MELNDKKVLVAGTGKSGICATKLLLEKGASVVLFDENKKLNEEEIKQSFNHHAKLSVIIGALEKEALEQVDLMVISPGIPVDAPFTNLIRDMEIPIWSEIELAYQAGAGEIAAITGTNGKTTTTSLVGEIMKAHKEETFVVGNIGIPYTQIANDTTENSVVVAEISSFQLETIIDFCPKVSAVLNVTPDHLNRHYTFENYADTKLKITMNQTEDMYCVLNYDDPVTREMADRMKATPVFFSRKTILDQGVFLRNGDIILKTAEAEEKILHCSELNLLGDHNIENVMAAVAIAYYMGVPVSCIHKVCTEFMGVEHRIEYVDTINGVTYYNDSKGTNPDAAIKGIQAMIKPTILIGGGYDKGVPFDDWIESFQNKVRYLVLIGDTAQMIADTANKHNFHDVVFAGSLEEAVKLCAELANPGDAVLLSPACASWDMFKSYEERGRLFKKYVGNLKG